MQADVRFEGPDGFIAADPSFVSFAQFVCASGSGRQSQDLEHDVDLPANATSLLSYVFTINVEPRSGSSPTQSPPDAAQQIFVLSREALAKANVNLDSIGRESAAPVAAVLVMAPLGAVVMLRRRRDRRRFGRPHTPHRLDKERSTRGCHEAGRA